MRDDSAKIVKGFVQETLVSSSGMDTGISTLLRCPSSISSADHGVAHPASCPERWFWRGCRACDVPEPCKFPSLDSYQERFLWTLKGDDFALQSSAKKERQFCRCKTDFLAAKSPTRFFYGFFFLSQSFAKVKSQRRACLQLRLCVCRLCKRAVCIESSCWNPRIAAATAGDTSVFSDSKHWIVHVCDTTHSLNCNI